MKKVLFRTFVKPLLPVLKLYWFLFRPKTTGVKCILQRNNKILLIKHSYGRDLWTLPGGGVKRNESPPAAAVREVSEEVGMTTAQLDECGSLFYDGEYKQNTIYVFKTTVSTDEFTIDDVEVCEAQWFSIDTLPKNKSHLLVSFLELAEVK